MSVTRSILLMAALERRRRSVCCSSLGPHSHGTAAYTKQDFHQALHRRLDDILAKAKPQQRVVLALDGPAPLAKLLEQR
jgi:5'-3' exonuclease